MADIRPLSAAASGSIVVNDGSDDSMVMLLLLLSTSLHKAISLASNKLLSEPYVMFDNSSDVVNFPFYIK